MHSPWCGVFDSLPRLDCDDCGVASGVFLLAGLWLRWTSSSHYGQLLHVRNRHRPSRSGSSRPLDYSVFSASATAVSLWFEIMGARLLSHAAGKKWGGIEMPPSAAEAGVLVNQLRTGRRGCVITGQWNRNRDQAPRAGSANFSPARIRISCGPCWRWRTSCGFP